MNTRTTVLPVAGAALIRLLGVSWRIHYAGEEHLAAARQHSRTVIYAFWHGRLLPLSYTHRGRAIHVLASRHADGELLGLTIRKLGFGHVRGSSSRGGARAIMELSDAVRDGYDLGITVDGPRGPRFVVKPGVVEIAKITGSAIVPITTASRRHRTFSSWDRFELPWPWTRVQVRHGAPVTVPADSDRDALEEKRLEVERILAEITAEADHDVAT